MSSFQLVCSILKGRDNATVTGGGRANRHRKNIKRHSFTFGADGAAGGTDLNQDILVTFDADKARVSASYVLNNVKYGNK